MSNKVIPDIASDDDLGKWIWQNLVPKSGQSESVQGELLRSIEKLRYEAQNNGNGNWDKGFELLIDYLEDKILGRPKSFFKSFSSIQKDLNRLRKFKNPYVDDDLYDRVSAEIFKFCRENPNLIVHEKNSKLKR
ncbi:hypothetical protein EHQ52_17110 [Leptospira koniambonensis]|uniref:Uncharacterized protein n=1 Tax=Leptospira koniambonensis TaxID=2484950 RepID=A0A4R9J401_9LEPT|nr:hypothetical protein [Leptospira koniambonensis]TGL31646.1 hypothetical protein EHQ52_17110 [Leptospira koniambonensis]